MKGDPTWNLEAERAASLLLRGEGIGEEKERKRERKKERKRERKKEKERYKENKKEKKKDRKFFKISIQWLLLIVIQ